MKNYLIVIDMQTDFVDGSLGTKEAVAIVPAVKKRIEEARAAGEVVIFTRDTHETEYLTTQEGRNLPVEHCIRGTRGWQIVPELKGLAEGAEIFDKPTFGSIELVNVLKNSSYSEIYLCGVCTGICVISNAMLAKAAVYETPVKVVEHCCACVTPDSHKTAIEAMKTCQIDIV